MPEALQQIFTCLSMVIKALAKRFAASIPALLHCSRRLRYYSAEHVRGMAAKAFAFPLRHASEKQLERAVAVIFKGGGLSLFRWLMCSPQCIYCLASPALAQIRHIALPLSSRCQPLA